MFQVLTVTWQNKLACSHQESDARKEYIHIALLTPSQFYTGIHLYPPNLHTHTHMHAHTHAGMHTHTHARTHAHICTHTQQEIHTCTYNTHTQKRIYK